MIEFESFKSNLDTTDKFGVNSINIHSSTIYSGKVHNIKNKCDYVKEKENKIKPLATAILGVNNTAAPLPNNTEFYTAWTDLDAQELYLQSKPTCYLILSKPGAGAYSLGEALSKKLNCIHLCPRNVITDELEQCSPTGKCIDFNMRHYNPCKFNTILSVIKAKMDSPAVQHRGYVLSGLPLVTSNRFPQYIPSLHDEDSILTMEEILYDVISNMKKKKPKEPKVNTSPHSSMSGEPEPEVEEEAEEEEEPEEAEVEEEELPVALPKCLLKFCSDLVIFKKTYIDTIKRILVEQINEIFDMKIKPDIIIYITCPDTDIVTKKSHKYFNYITGSNTIDPFTFKTDIDTRWPTKYNMTDYLSPHDSHVFNSKYNCRQPFNFKENTIEQLCNYKHHVYPVVQQKFNNYEPKLVIKLDGRITVHQMMYNLMERFISMDIKPVIIPEPLYLEEPPEDPEEFWKTVEELNIIRNGTISFKRYASPWLNRCPVELKKRQSVNGRPKFAVAFMKHVYVLSSLDNMVLFCRNPRPYLKLKFLEPTCRIIVTGTKSSGKTMISECLSWLFDTPILCYKTFLASETKKKYDAFAKTILSEIIATIEDARFMKWQSMELERVSNLDVWYNSTLDLLKLYIPFLKETLEYEYKELETPFLNEFNKLRSRLSFLPIIDKLDMCNQALYDRSLFHYAPQELITPTVKPSLPALGDEDVTEAISAYIVANDLQRDIVPTPEELVNEITKILTDIDEECQKATGHDQMYGKFIIDGFPSDPEYWGYLSDFKLLPDYTIAIIENKEIDPELVQNYINIENYIKNYQERFLLANDDLIKLKLCTKQPENTSLLDMKIIINDFLNHLFESTTETEKRELENVEVNIPEELLVSVSESIEKFREEWDSSKLKLEDEFKCYIEIELENKTDIEIVEEMLLKIRQSYYLTCSANEDEGFEGQDEEDEGSKDVLTFNYPQNLCETSLYCPVAFCDYGVLWEGKSEFCINYNNRVHYFCKEEFSEIFQKDVTKYESYNNPFKKLPALRICVIGCIGSGKSTISKLLAKELGLIHIDFSDVINEYLLPQHFRKVGRKYENCFTDIPIDDEAVVEFQMDEDNDNLEADILSNETELRRMLFNYFERGVPLLSILMQKLIKKLWFQQPFSTTGFVLDGFPRMPTDVEDMVACYCIPDLIIELECSPEIILSRLSPLMFKTWKVQLIEAKTLARKKFNDEYKRWTHFITQRIVIILILDEVLDNVLLETEEPVKVPSTESTIVDAHPSGSAHVDANLFNSYNELIQEIPAPVDQSEWERPDEVRDRIDARLEGIYESDDENLQNLKDALSEQKMKIVTINSTKPLNKVFRNVLLKLTSLRNRTQSFFEQTFIISGDIADMLLVQGFFFLSKFNRMCPVYILENPDSIINPYKVSKRKGQIFPVVHRCYIYYISTKENLKKFRRDPLKYVICENVNFFIEYPLRIGVIGPPKSGKSTLSAKLAKKYGLLCLSKGMAIRSILENMYWTELASKMINALQKGESIACDLIMKAVHTVALDYRTTSSGFVLDGFPDYPSQAMELTKKGLYPLIVFDLSCNKKNVIDYSQHEIYLDIIKRKPPYSSALIDFKFMQWNNTYDGIRDWIKCDVQNLIVLNGNESRWQCVQHSNNYINYVIPKVHNFLTNVNINIVPVDVMCISNDIFQKRMSVFKNMCPVCLHENIIKHSGFPVDRKGVLLYKNRFYWVCSDHIQIILKYPERYLVSITFDVQEIPAIVKTIDLSLVYENGICIVTYAENLPDQKIIRGLKQYAANYNGKTYLFCSDKCFYKFMSKPHMYFDIIVFKETNLFKKISLKNLPNLGYLEQTVGNIMTDACCSVNVMRPKYPGLSIQLSALIYIGLYLKIHNPLVDKTMLPMYTKTFKIYEARCKLMIDIGLRLRSMDNPFASYPKCCVVKNEIVNNIDFGTVHKPSSTVSSICSGLTDFNK